MESTQPLSRLKVNINFINNDLKIFDFIQNYSQIILHIILGRSFGHSILNKPEPETENFVATSTQKMLINNSTMDMVTIPKR